MYVQLKKKSFYRVKKNYLYSITVCSAAPQTTLWGGPEPRFEPGPGGPRPPRLLTVFVHNVGPYTVFFSRPAQKVLIGQDPDYIYRLN